MLQRANLQDGKREDTDARAKMWPIRLKAAAGAVRSDKMETKCAWVVLIVVLSKSSSEPGETVYK